jgi:hypothetical protein
VDFLQVDELFTSGASPAQTLLSVHFYRLEKERYFNHNEKKALSLFTLIFPPLF